MARTGSPGLFSIDPDIAINRQGIIAFTGSDFLGSRVFVVSKPGEFMSVKGPGILRFFAGIGITSGSNPAVVYRDFPVGLGYILRKTDVSGSSDEILGSSVSLLNPADWDSITSDSIDVPRDGPIASPNF
jgi:hypothetical protein